MIEPLQVDQPTTPDPDTGYQAAPDPSPHRPNRYVRYIGESRDGHESSTVDHHDPTVAIASDSPIVIAVGLEEIRMPSDVDTHELRDWWRRRQSRNEYLKSFYRKWRSAWRRYESASAVLHDLDPQFRHGAGRAQSLAVRLPVSTESGLLLPAWMCQRPSDLDYLELYRRIELAGAGAEERHDIAANVLQRDVADVRRSYYSALRAVKSSLKEQERAVVERSLRPSRPR